MAFKKPFTKRKEHKTNEEITAQTVRIVGDNIESKICSLSEALEIAKNLTVDLVEISSNSQPVVCRVVDYSKFLYENKKKLKGNKNKTKLKEVQLSANIGQHDLDFKIKNAKGFLEDKNKVKVSIRFKGREMIYTSQAEVVMANFALALDAVGKVDALPKLEGKQMLMFISPK